MYATVNKNVFKNFYKIRSTNFVNIIGGILKIGNCKINYIRTKIEI